ncbi:hypothetical protein TNCV_1087431 [Trichonephila clavipes]|nr:hypothetical protein TNCV_1087431 [Trichonephila clavipes]
MRYLLVKHGANVNFANKDCNKALGCAVFKGRLDTIKYHIEDTQADLNVQDNDGNVKMTELLITQYAKINTQDKDESTPLHKAN